MKYVNYPEQDQKRLSFYLATEEYLALNYPEDEYFFMWQTRPTVIFGRNQLIENEVNLEYVKSNNIEFYRRKSGGGCVYSDNNNIMFSFITTTFNKDFVFDKYLSRIVSGLKTLKINAYFSGRNDILLNEQKISGNAFYRVGNRSVVHGTMMYDVDVSSMVKSITPNNEKLISKGIDSVRSRVTNLKDHFDLDLDTFKQKMKSYLSDEEITLSLEDMDKIRLIEKEYLDEDFIYGKNPNYSLIKKKRTNAGQLEVTIELKNNIIKKMNILGDYFLLNDVDFLINKFKNQPFDKEILSNLMTEKDVSDTIYNLSKYELLELLFEVK